MLYFSTTTTNIGRVPRAGSFISTGTVINILVTGTTCSAWLVENITTTTTVVYRGVSTATGRFQVVADIGVKATGTTCFSWL
jgi:hypothetical protein